MHRWDAELATGWPGRCGPSWPATGCPSSFRSWSGGDAGALSGTVTLTAIDTGASWQVGRRARRRVGAGAAELRATASDLVLMLYRRLPVPDAAVVGRPHAGGRLPLAGRHAMTELAFLGTGNFLAPPGRYWNSFVMDTSVLVEPCPTALPNLRRCGFSVEDVEVVVISHFHADHCFGWPFFCRPRPRSAAGARSTSSDRPASRRTWPR